MEKIYIPGNVMISNNARKHIEKIERNGNYRSSIKNINKMMDFVSSTPLDLRATPNSWHAEKLTVRGEIICSFRINDNGDRFTYKVYKDGDVEILGLLGHYKGTGYGLYSPNFGKISDMIAMFYNGDVVYDELMKMSEGVQVKPSLEYVDKEQLMSLKEKIASGTLTKDDITEFEIIDGENHYYLNRKEVEETKEEQTHKM